MHENRIACGCGGLSLEGKTLTDTGTPLARPKIENELPSIVAAGLIARLFSPAEFRRVMREDAGINVKLTASGDWKAVDRSNEASGISELDGRRWILASQRLGEEITFKAFKSYGSATAAIWGRYLPSPFYLPRSPLLSPNSVLIATQISRTLPQH